MGSGVPPSFPDEIVNQVPRRWYPAGSMILEERTRCRALMLLEQGRVAVTKADVELVVLVAGDFIGELAVLGDGRAHAGYRAVDDCTLLVFEDESLRQVLQLPGSSTSIRKSYRDRLQQMLLAVSPLLRALPDADARQLLRRCRPMRLEDGQVLMQEGDVPSGLFFVMLGRLVVTEGGQELEQLGDGDHFGELAILRDTPSQQTVTAHGFCQLVQLRPSDLIQLAAQSAELGALLRQHAVGRDRRYQAMRER